MEPKTPRTCRFGHPGCQDVIHTAPSQREVAVLEAERERALELLKAAYLGKTHPAPLSTRSWYDRTRALLKECGFL